MDATRKASLQAQITSSPQAVIAALTPELAGRDPDVGYLLGIAHYRLKQFVEAESALRGAVANGAGAEAFYYLGLCAERQGRIADAVQIYGKASALNPALTQAADKVAALAPGTGPSAHSRPPAPNNPPAHPPPARNRPSTSELTLPETEEEFVDYERRRKRKAKIDARAQYSAELSGLPLWAKVLVGVIAAWIIAGVIVMQLGGREGQQANLPTPAPLSSDPPTPAPPTTDPPTTDPPTTDPPTTNPP
jgi:tetratricopeptide (TPR) repeat protein